MMIHDEHIETVQTTQKHNDRHNTITSCGAASKGTRLKILLMGHTICGEPVWYNDFPIKKQWPPT